MDAITFCIYVEISYKTFCKFGEMTIKTFCVYKKAVLNIDFCYKRRYNGNIKVVEFEDGF